MCERCKVPNLTFDGTNVTVFDGKPIAMSFHFYHTGDPENPIDVVSRTPATSHPGEETIRKIFMVACELVAQYSIMRDWDPTDMMARATAEVAPIVEREKTLDWLMDILGL
jgi:hypothetical protein